MMNIHEASYTYNKGKDLNFPSLSFVVVQSVSEWGIAGIFSGVGSHRLISMSVRRATQVENS